MNYKWKTACFKLPEGERERVCLTKEENIGKSCVKVYMSARTEWHYGESDAIAESNVPENTDIFDITWLKKIGL